MRQHKFYAYHYALSCAPQIYQSDLARKFIAVGKVEGRVEGRADLILKLLTIRYGDLVDPAVQEKVRKASAAQLEGIAERILKVDTLDRVLGSL